MRKLFLAMSAESQGQANRYLAPWSIFESEDESRRRESIMKILKDPLRIKCYLFNADSLVEPEKSWRPVIGLGQYSCNYTTYFSNQLVLEPIELVRSSVQWRKKFVHRNHLPLHSIETSLDSDHHVILYGMPGVGKSELAAQVVAHALECHKYRAYLWIRANSEEQIFNDYIRIATTLGLVT